MSEVLDVLVQRAGLQKRPALYVVPSMAVNAFAAGKPEHAAIALTEGLLRRGYKSEEVQKVMGGNWVRLYGQIWQ